MSTEFHSSHRKLRDSERTSKTSPVFDKLPPQDLDAERSLLGSILLVNDVIDEVSDVIIADSFYLDAHQKIYQGILQLHEAGIRGIDAVTLSNELEKRGVLEEIGGDEYLIKVLESVPHAAHAKYYATIIRDKAIQRNLIYACTEILKESYEDTLETPEILQRAESSIFQILEQQENTERMQLKDILLKTFDVINERLEREGEVSGLSTGFMDLDAKTNGFQPTELIILAARPSMGKTAFVMNMAEAVATHTQKGVAIFSLEQSKLELAERLLCMRARLDGHKLRKGDLNEEERDKLMVASAELSDLPLFIDDQPARTMAQIGAISRRLKRRYHIGLIIIDYLQLIEPEDKRAPREQQIANIARRLKFLAKELEVPVIALAQLNRGVELREDKRPRLADLRESGAIEQDADLVMFLHRPDAYDPEDQPGLAEIIIAKHRSGPTGIVPLTWKKESMKFVDFSSLAEPPGGYFSDVSSGDF
ncbi:MAG: replicative DNA helicase [Planctomycetales bacterium]